MMRLLLTSLYVFTVFGLNAQPAYASFNAFLSKHVSASGKVNYSAIKKNKVELEEILMRFSKNAPDANWKKEDLMVYWINVYNGYTIKLIADNYPLKSITELDGGKTWDVKRIPIGKEKYSLNQIENDMLRARFNDARIHFVLNCGAKSCPPLYNQAFTAVKIEQQLENRTKAYIQSTQINLSEKQVKISKIFDWYAADFMSKAELNNSNSKRIALIKFLKKYSKVNISMDATVSFLEYDWSLNN